MHTERTDMAVAFLIRTGVTVSGIIAVTVIAVPIIAPMIAENYAVPDQIKEWGGVIIGFYFGSFITLVGNLLRRPEAPPQTPPEPQPTPGGG